MFSLKVIFSTKIIDYLKYQPERLRFVPSLQEIEDYAVHFHEIKKLCHCVL